MGSGRLWGRLCAHAHRQARVRGYVLCEGVLRVCACQMRTQYSQPTYVRLGLRLPRLPSQAAAANAHCSRVTGPLWPSALGINAYISLWHSSVSVCIHLWRGGTQCTLVWSGMSYSKSQQNQRFKDCSLLPQMPPRARYDLGARCCCCCCCPPCRCSPPCCCWSCCRPRLVVKVATGSFLAPPTARGALALKGGGAWPGALCTSAAGGGRGPAKACG